MASHKNSGSARTYDFMQRMFCFEPVGVFEDFFEGLSETVSHRESNPMLHPNLSQFVRNCIYLQGLKLKTRHSPRIMSDHVEVKVVIPGEPEVTTAGALLSDGYDDDYDVLELWKSIGRFNQSIIVLNGTEDQLVVVADAEKTFQAICENAQKQLEETGRSPEGLGPTMFTVGLGAGTFPSDLHM